MLRRPEAEQPAEATMDSWDRPLTPGSENALDKPELRLPPILSRHARAIRAMLEPCVDLTPVLPQAGAAPTDSRLFGGPCLQHAGDWPCGPDGRPLAFVGQLDLGSLSRFSVPGSALPDEGLLSFFYDFDSASEGTQADDRYGFRILWTPHLAQRYPVAAPAGTPDIGAREWSLRASPAWRLPSEVDSRFLLADLTEEEFLAYDGLSSSLAPLCEHRVLGPADWLEEDARASCAEVTSRLWPAGRTPASGPDWRLLWQIGGTPHLSNAYGGDMRLYVMIREEDLAERRFLRAWVTLQRG